MLTVLILYGPCGGHHSSTEFMHAASLSWSGDGLSPWPFLTSGSYDLSVSSSAMSPEPWWEWIRDVLFLTEHFTGLILYTWTDCWVFSIESVLINTFKSWFQKSFLAMEGEQKFCIIFTFWLCDFQDVLSMFWLPVQIWQCCDTIFLCIQKRMADFIPLIKLLWTGLL